MNYIIDGHNLIGKIPGLTLSDLDDEQHLIELLVHFSQKNRGRLEVYFDGALPGQAGEASYGRVKAHFVVHSSSADQAIRFRLQALGRASRNWVVVTSDRSVQAAAREAHAQVMSAEEFSRKLQESMQASLGGSKPGQDEPLSEEEVRQWLEIFRGRNKPNP